MSSGRAPALVSVPVDRLRVPTAVARLSELARRRCSERELLRLEATLPLGLLRELMRRRVCHVVRFCTSEPWSTSSWSSTELAVDLDDTTRAPLWDNLKKLPEFMPVCGLLLVIERNEPLRGPLPSTSLLSSGATVLPPLKDGFHDALRTCLVTGAGLVAGEPAGAASGSRLKERPRLRGNMVNVLDSSRTLATRAIFCVNS